MKKIEAIIKPFDSTRSRTPSSGWGQGSHGDRSEGFRRQRGHTEAFRGGEYQVDFVPKVKWKWWWTLTGSGGRRCYYAGCSDRQDW